MSTRSISTHNICFGLEIRNYFFLLCSVGENGYNGSCAEHFIAFLQQVLNSLIQEHEFKILFYIVTCTLKSQS